MSIPVQKNELVTADIVGLTHEGDGVGRVDGFTLFIKGALPGERVRAKVLKVKKQYGYAKLLELEQASPDRLAAPCPIHASCGGCQLQHMSYEAQLRWKRQHVADTLQRIGKLPVAQSSNTLLAASGSGELPETAGEREPVDGRDPLDQAESGMSGLVPAAKTMHGDIEAAASRTAAAAGAEEAAMDAASGGMTARDAIVVHETIGMADPWRYRNKAQVPIGLAAAGADAGAAGRLVGGFYAQGSHRIVDMEACLIQHERNDRAVQAVKRIGTELGITAYDETSGRGLLRHVVVRSGFVSGEAMVVLVTNGRRIPREDEWIAGIRAALPEATSIVQNINTRQTNVIFGDETQVLWGSEVIYDELDGIRFAISARSFYQVNPEQTVALYRKAVEYAGLTGAEAVIDAYCGIGTISLFLARRAARVYGVEVVPEAIRDAQRNAVLNGIDNATFEVGLSEEVIPRWRKEGIEADVIVVDPPRKGCDAALLETILQMRPKRVVYVSCNPATLARDLRVLEDGGYRTVEAQPVDMFPWTVHVECLILMVRK